MKPLIASVIAACGLMTGCVAVPATEGGVYVSGTVRSDGHAHSHGRGYNGPRRSGRRDSDGDGVPNRHDRRPRNPNWY